MTMPPTVQRKHPDVCGPAALELGWAIGVVLYVLLLAALGALLLLARPWRLLWGYVLAGAALLGVAALTVVLVCKELWQRTGRLRARRAWLQKAVVRQAGILSRSEEYDEYGETREDMWQYRLILAIEEPPAPAVEVWVSERVYERLAKQSSATLYCDPAAPLTFLMEGE